MNKDQATGVLYGKWISPSTKAAVLFVHGLGGHSGRCEFLADFLLKKEISCYAIELKGFGETEDPKGHIDSFDIYFEDIKALVSIIKKENVGKKVFLYAESLGGLIGFLFIVKYPELVDGFIGSSPAFGSKLKFSVLDQLKVFAARLYNPRKQFVVPFTAQMCTSDVDYQKVMEESSAEHRWATPGLLINSLFAQIKVNFVKSKFAVPALFLVSGKDVLVDTASTEKLFKKLKIEDKTLFSYPDMLHCLYIDLGREKVFQDVVNWIEKRI